MIRNVSEILCNLCESIVVYLNVDLSAEMRVILPGAMRCRLFQVFGKRRGKFGVCGMNGWYGDCGGGYS